MMQKIRKFAVAVMAATLLAGAANAVELDLWHVFNLETDMIHAGIRDYQAANPDVVIETRVLPFSQLSSEFVKAIATGEVPDLVVIDNPVMAGFADQGALAQLDDLIAQSQSLKPENFYPGPWSTVRWNGKTYGVPRDSNTLALYYNADLFRAKGLDPDAPPATWDELMLAAEKLTDPANNVFGFAFSAVQSEEGTFQFLPWLQQNGADIDSLDSPEAAEALRFWTDIVSRGYASKDVVTMRQYEAANTYIAGNAAMVTSGPWEMPRIAAEAKFDYRVALMPAKDPSTRKASALGGFNWSIPAGSDNREEAFKVIEYMTSPAVFSHAWESGRLPSRADVVTPDPQWPESFAIFSEQMKTARARGPHPKWYDISRALQSAIQEALTGAETPEAALKKASATVNRILDKTPLDK